MGWSISCGILAFLLIFLLTLKAIMGDNDETRALRLRLRAHGIDPRRFTSQCLTELIETRSSHLRLVERSIDVELARCIEQVAKDVRNLCFGRQGFSKSDLQAQAETGVANPCWATLARHDPFRFDLEFIEQTQSFHREAGETLAAK